MFPELTLCSNFSFLYLVRSTHTMSSSSTHDKAEGNLKQAGGKVRRVWHGVERERSVALTCTADQGDSWTRYWKRANRSRGQGQEP
jgi:hypothetical protein